MKPGLFKVAEDNILFVNSDRFVVNGAFEVEYHEDDDSVSFNGGPRAKRVSTDETDLRGDYNEVIGRFLTQEKRAEKKTLTLGDLFSEAELRTLMREIALARRDRNGVSANKRLVPLLEPMMARINEVTGQENDVRYIGYMIEAAFEKWTEKK